MRILLTNLQLTSRTGTETAVCDLAKALAAAGHAPAVFSPQHGEIAGEIERAGIPVVTDPRDLSEAPEIIHGHHHVETVRALLAFPHARGIFVCHDRRAWHDSPPLFPRIARYVAVDLNCRERLVGSGVPEARIRIVHNAVDTGRFRLREPLPAAPGRAAVFSNYAGPGTHVEAVAAACARLGIALDVIGSGSGNGVPHPECVLGGYDLVFAKARCALEAMATGTAVVLCDTSGLGPMVTTANVERLRPWNFGARCLTEPLEPDRIAEEVRRYHPRDAHRVAGYIREYAALDGAVREYLSIYDEALAGSEPVGGDEVAGYLRATAERMGSLESALERAHGIRWMGVLAKNSARRIQISIARAVECVQAGEIFGVAVEIANRTEIPLASIPPCPVHISYRWLAKRRWLSGRGSGVFEGLRTRLPETLDPGTRALCTARIAAPKIPGQYLLRMTLVQEGWRWLDEFGGVIADTPVTVRETP